MTNRVTERFQRFAFFPPTIQAKLAEIALSENWGADNKVLNYYIATYVPWSIEQNCYSYDLEKFYVTAGCLQTRYGTPIYLTFEKNRDEEEFNIPWALTRVDTEIYYAPKPPNRPNIPKPPDIPFGAEIVMKHDHILGDNAARIPFFRDVPPVAQICAVSGAIQWSLNRKLALPYWYYGRMNYIVPLYLQSREDITQAPDAIAPIEVRPEYLFVRTVLENYMPYASARVGVLRHDALPNWLSDAWAKYAEELTEDEIENPERVEEVNSINEDSDNDEDNS
ncbi:MAG: DUF3825 domain-containing protein [Microcystaceae cyanobacterium]